MRMVTQRQKPRTSQLAAFPAPRNGWVANLNLAQPQAKNADGTSVSGAAVLDNMFPTATGVRLIRGSELYATLGDGSKPTTALFAYINGTVEKMFGATASAIYDITTIITPFNYSIATEGDDPIETDDGDTFGEDSTGGLDVFTGTTGGDWITVQFATAGGVFLAGVNGMDFGFQYDGASFYPTLEGGLWALNYDAETADFTENETLTGGTSGATATIVKVIDNGATGTLYLTDIAGTFEDDEAITDGEGGAAVADGVVSVLAGATTFDDDPGFDTSDLSYVWAYKQRLFFVQKETLDAWYLPVDQVAGELVRLPLGGVFQLGGSLLFGASWSTDAGEQGGLSEQMIVVTTEGEVAVFQGANPGDASDWSKVGVYRIGRPLGAKAWIRDGGDLIISTSIGYVRLSEAIRRELAALGPTAVSYPIETAWNEAVDRRGFGWHCEVWPSKQMAVVALPTQGEEPPAMFLANVRTGSWCRRLNWDGTCVLVFKERLFFGSQDGKVVEANVTGLDQGETYTGICVPLFDDLGTPASLKITGLARVVGLSPLEVDVAVSMQTDYHVDLPPPPDAASIPVGNEWGNAIWGTSTWGTAREMLPRQEWVSAAGSGYALSPAFQITSGSAVPIDYELIRIEAMYQTADVVS